MNAMRTYIQVEQDPLDGIYTLFFDLLWNHEFQNKLDHESYKEFSNLLWRSRFNHGSALHDKLALKAPFQKLFQGFDAWFFEKYQTEFVLDALYGSPSGAQQRKDEIYENEKLIAWAYFQWLKTIETIRLDVLGQVENSLIAQK